MATMTYRKAVKADARELAINLRKADRKELIGIVGDALLQEIEYCIEASEQAFVCECDGKLMAAFGVYRTSPFENIGVIWMLATTETVKHKVYVGKWTKKGLQAFLKDWDLLYNYIDQGNSETIKWLKWLGAKVYPAQPYGLYGLPYHKFVFEG